MKLSSSIVLISLLTLVMLVFTEHSARLEISEPNLINGWIFFTFLVLLLLYYVRKKLSVLPLGNMSSWLTFHILCAGGFIVTYFFHIGATIPTGPFNILLWGSNLLVIITGLFGWFAGKVLPKEIHQIGDKPIQEDIPRLRTQLIDEAETTVLQYLQNHYSEPLHRLFIGSVYPFLLSTPSLFTTVTQGHKPFRQLLNEIEELDYFVTHDEQSVLSALKQKVKRKHHIDKQSLLQSILRHWLFLHAGSVVVLLVCVLLHIFAVYGFSMGGA